MPPTKPSTHNSSQGGAQRSKGLRRPFRTNTHCTQCKRELRKNEGAICDECRMTALGWKRA